MECGLFFYSLTPVTANWLPIAKKVLSNDLANT